MSIHWGLAKAKKMDKSDKISENLKKIIQMSESSEREVSDCLHRQHYDFAHKIVPYIIVECFDDLIAGTEDDSAQKWFHQIWQDNGHTLLSSYSVVIYPEFSFLKISDEIGVGYFVMPAPRNRGEVVYGSIVFLIDAESPSTWLRRYYTLELGLPLIPTADLPAALQESNPTTYWVLGEWDNYKHLNHGRFDLEPKLSNFISASVQEAQKNRR
ncbi:hypothetical protein VZH09_06695 [Synechococcus elongatus IITB7]|uniref:hypothetical protein n=1 Tax=Synechococcus elongatus TaxID=32046 RepID=UPI0030CE81D3